MGSQLPGNSLYQQPLHEYNQANNSHGQVAPLPSIAMGAQPTSATKTLAQSAYPSPADEFKHSLAASSPMHPYSSALFYESERLPPISEILKGPISPSASPQVAFRLDGRPASLGSPMMPAPMSRTMSGNTYTGNSYRSADPPLFPASGTVEDHLPLFSSSDRSAFSNANLTTRVTPHQRKRTPVQSFARHPLEPPSTGQGAWSLARINPDQYHQDRRAEYQLYLASSQKSQSSMVNGLPSSQDSPRVPRDSMDPERIPMTGPKRSRVARGEGLEVTRTGTRSTPREALADSFEEAVPVAKKPKSAKRAATPAQPPAKRLKPSPEVPDTAYTLYTDYTPEISTLNSSNVHFSFPPWNGRPMNLDNDPDRDLLHDKEIKLATKLALTCARYLYLKRRFYAGRLEYVRRNQTYNINAAQQTCKGADSHGVVGADVNKTSSMWKAFNSVGWLDPAHMQPYLDGTHS